MGSLVIGWYTFAGVLVVQVERDFSGTHLQSNSQITHFFITYFQHMTILSTFTHHIYSRVGDTERTWLTKSVVPNTLIQFDSNTFPLDTGTIFHTEATFLSSVLYYYMCMFMLRSFYGTLIHLYNFLLAGWLYPGDSWESPKVRLHQLQYTSV